MSLSNNVFLAVGMSILCVAAEATTSSMDVIDWITAATVLNAGFITGWWLRTKASGQ